MHAFYAASSGTLMLIYPEGGAGRPLEPWHSEVFAWIDLKRLEGRTILGSCKDACDRFELLKRFNLQSVDSVMSSYRNYMDEDIPARVLDAVSDGDVESAARDLELCGPVFVAAIREKFPPN